MDIPAPDRLHFYAGRHILYCHVDLSTGDKEERTGCRNHETVMLYAIAPIFT